MFKKLSVINSIKRGFYYGNNKIIYQSQNLLKEFDIIGNFSKDCTRLDVRLSGIFCFDNLYLGLTGMEYLIFDREYRLLERAEFVTGNYNLYFGRYLVKSLGYDMVSLQSKLGLYDLKDKNLLWETNYGELIRLVDESVYCSSFKEVTKRDLHTGKLQWVFNIEEIAPSDIIIPLIGVHKNILVGGIGTNWLFGIDTNSGKLAWKRKTIPNFDKIDKKNEVLHTISVGYVRSDIFTGKILDMFDDSSYFEEEVGIESHRNNYVQIGDYLITTDWRKGRIGAFNTLTHRFDWIHDEPGVSFPGATPIRYHDPYLFLMDNKNNLHIFKKE